MANPNLLNATSIYSETASVVGTGSSVTVFTVPSNKVYRITTLHVNSFKVKGQNEAKWDLRLNKAGIHTTKASLGSDYDSGNASEILANGCNVSFPTGWVCEETDVLVIRAEEKTQTFIGYEVIDDA
mgnify:FL=1